jgi:CDP-6-deoxy-D-xylo-4-hexulose-3-dehydrase|tara:strand:+ start:235 stop:1407 length:1173 start_codon:yes stop_codon:yes gene_type:complete
MTTYPLAHSTWGKEEVEAIQKVVDSDMYTMGKHVKQFEQEFAEKFGSENAVMVNSGSSANLLMLSLLKWKYKLSGDIIVPVVGWATTYFPIAQNGFKINFVDVDPDTWNIDVNKIEQAITPNTCAIMPVNLLGNSCEYDKIIEICRKHNLMLIEDNCESMGARYHKGGDFSHTGTIGLAGSFSFFFSHHIQTMEGGMVLTDSKDDADYMRSLRAHGWVRELPDDSMLYQKTGNAFDDNFIFATPGYNIRPLEMSGAIGSVQLKKWDDIMDVRSANKRHFRHLFANKPWCRVQKEIGESSWFTFGIVLDGELKGRRADVVKALDEAGIQNRPLASRNFLKQPVMRELDHIASGEMTAADDIHDNGFFVGNGSKDLTDGIDTMYEVISGFVK